MTAVVAARPRGQSKSLNGIFPLGSSSLSPRGVVTSSGFSTTGDGIFLHARDSSAFHLTSPFFHDDRKNYFHPFKSSCTLIEFINEKCKCCCKISWLYINQLYTQYTCKNYSVNLFLTELENKSFI